MTPRTKKRLQKLQCERKRIVREELDPIRKKISIIMEREKAAKAKIKAAETAARRLAWEKQDVIKKGLTRLLNASISARTVVKRMLAEYKWPVTVAEVRKWRWHKHFRERSPRPKPIPKEGYFRPGGVAFDGPASKWKPTV